MKKVLILGGVGAIGSEATRDIVETSEFSEIVVGDIDVERAERFVSELGDDRLSAMRVDASNLAELVEAVKGFDRVVSALPFRYDINVTRACIRAGVYGIDVASEGSQFDLSEEAKRAGVLSVPGCGATPGTTNLMAKYGIQYLDEAESVEIYFAAFRCTAIAPGLLYTTFWEFDPKVERTYYEDGRYVRVGPFEGEREVEFHELIGRQKCYYVPHEEVMTLPMVFPQLRKVEVRGCFPPKTMELMRILLRYGLYQDEPIQVGDAKVLPRDFFFNFLLQSREAREEDVWAYGLVVVVRGRKRGVETVVTLKNRHPPMEVWGGRRAYAKNVGIPLSIGAQIIARGGVDEFGVLPPEAVFDPEEFFRELAKRGIDIDVRIEQYGVGRAE